MADKLKLSDEQKLALVESIDYTRLSETALQRAYETELVPSSQVTKAALALCRKLREELREAQEVISGQERELEGHKLDTLAKYKMSVPSRSHYKYRPTTTSSRYSKDTDSLCE